MWDTFNFDRIWKIRKIGQIMQINLAGKLGKFASSVWVSKKTQIGFLQKKMLANY